MPRHLSPGTTLDGLKREAKRWLRALREHEGDASTRARERLDAAFPSAPANPTLRDIQHAVAREYGFDGWTALKRALAAVPLSTSADDSIATDDARRATLFLEHACPDHHVRGGSAHVRARHAAMRMLERYPELAHETFYTSVVCGERGDVERALAERPAIANEPNPVRGPARTGAGNADDQFRDLGPKPWEPLLFLCFTRLPLDSVTNNAVAIAQLLLESGANPNAYFMAGSSRYTPLTGIVGEGEEDRPPHQCRDELARVLLDAGAEPYDIQVFYNIHFHGNVLWFLKLIHEYSVKRGRGADWNDPDWSMLGMGGYGPGAHYLLKVAVDHNDLAAAKWMLAHGANPNLPVYSHPKFRPTRSLYEEAIRAGYDEMAELLARHGAVRPTISFTGLEEFSNAAFRLNRSEAARLAAEHPEYLMSTAALFEAARRDRADVIALLLDIGVSPNIADKTGQRALHAAAYQNSLNTARVLVARGADIDPVDSNWDNTPLGAASYAQRAEMIAYLTPLSSDFWEIVYAGALDRARELLEASPERARIVTANGHTPLMWLPPSDERRALDMAKLLVSRGADPSIRNSDGQTAADRAERLGMYVVAEYLRSSAAPESSAPPFASTAGAGSAPLRLEDYELRAQALLDAYRRGSPEAMQRHWALTWHRRTWSAMRTYVQLDLGRAADDPDKERDLTVDDAHFLIAREHGFDSWSSLETYVARLPATPGAVAMKPVALLAVGERDRVRAVDHTRDWDSVVARIAGEQLDGIDARGQMTDALLEHVTRVECIRVLKLSGSRGVTDAGMRLLARLPRLERLELDGCSITDVGMSVVRELRDLRSVSVAWTAITDVGAEHLAGCEQLENVNLAGTPTGDGAIAALRGRPSLRHLSTGNAVSDAGLPMLHDFPAFKTWRVDNESFSFVRHDAPPTQLTIRGPFTNRGLATLAGLDGLFALNVDDHELTITGAGLAPLVAMPNLGSLAFDAHDDAMPYIAALPRLRFLLCQDTDATDDGWVALGQSRSIERIWGRRCYGLRDRGFEALSTMPSLRALAASCKNVSDAALALLPRFPALRELMPMDVPDEGYRHIGRCTELESLILMYCRETTDRSTEHIAGLRKLRKYFASYNKITDRSLEILGGMHSLEEVELSAVPGVTNAGVAALARLPRLREVRLSGQQLTREVLSLFPPTVRAHLEV